MYLEIAGPVDLYVVLSIDGDERYLSQHFEGGIGFGIRIVFYAVRNFVNFCFYKGFWATTSTPFSIWASSQV